MDDATTIANLLDTWAFNLVEVSREQFWIYPLKAGVSWDPVPTTMTEASDMMHSMKYTGSLRLRPPEMFLMLQRYPYIIGGSGRIFFRGVHTEHGPFISLVDSVLIKWLQPVTAGIP